jgi:hypothetical protein
MMTSQREGFHRIVGLERSESMRKKRNLFNELMEGF